MTKIIIAIDGYSSTGKSTAAKSLAKALDYLYVDTGAMYRAVTLYAIRKGYIGGQIEHLEELKSELENLEVVFKRDTQTGEFQIYLNGKSIEDEIRSLAVSQQVSKISAIPEVRKKLVAQQQKMGRQKGVVMDGRDIGTVVFPNAELKIFMTASAEKRAQRRYQEILKKGGYTTYDAVLKNLQERDHLDSTRKTSPLRKATDAIEFDNTHLELNEQFNQLLHLAQKTIQNTETSSKL